MLGAGPRALARLRTFARRHWEAVLAAPDGAGRVARGAAAGAFAAMIPAFGLHLAIALAAAMLARGSAAAAAATCVLVGNPLTHLVILPAAYELGHWLAPIGVPEQGWLPGWVREALPVAEEAVAGGALLGAMAAAITFVGVGLALRRRYRSGDRG